MNRPIGFDLADLTATEAKAARHDRPAPASYARQQAAYAVGIATKRRRQQQTRGALIAGAKVTGGALATIGTLAYFAVFFGA